MNMLTSLVKKYGLKGAILFANIKAGVEMLQVPGIKNPIQMRPGTSDRPLFKQIFLNGEYNFKLKGFTAKRIIDAGANAGYSPVYFANRFPEADIVAIEPESSNFSTLQTNIRNYPAIKALKGGLWSDSCMLEIVSLTAEKTGFEVRVTNNPGPDSVQAYSIIDIMNSNGWDYVDLIKIDIEGSEIEVLSKNNSWIDKTAVILVELHDRKRAGCSRAFLDAFQAFDFEIHPFKQNFMMVNRKFYTS